jgi:tetratricopeptide (TPR) repeat protein
MRLTSGAMCVLAVLVSGPRSAFGQSESRTQVRVVPAEEQALHDLLVKAKGEADGNNYAAAQADYQKYLAQRPNDAAAHFDLGYVYTAQQENGKAISEYREAIELDPKMIQAQLNLGISLLPDDPQAAIAPLQKAIELNYAFERAHYVLGIAEERSRNAAAAEKEYTVAVKLDPNDADAQAALGRTFLAEGKAAEAEAAFRELLKLKPGSQEAEMGLAQSLLQQKKTADAIDALTAYLNENPNDAKACVMQASALIDLGKNDEALAALDRAAQSAPETVGALKLRSVIYDRKSDFAKAAAVLQKAEAMAPEDASIHARLGHALLETKNYSGAAHELNEALRLDPSSTDTLRDLVSAEYLQKDFAGTLAALDALARREPPNAGAWFVRASCYDQMSQPEEALADYQKFLAMNTDRNSNQYFEAAERVRFLQAALKQKGR